MRQQGGGCHNKGDVVGRDEGGRDILALVVTRPGIGRRNESKRGEEEDSVTAMAAILGGPSQRLAVVMVVRVAVAATRGAVATAAVVEAVVAAMVGSGVSSSGGIGGNGGGLTITTVASHPFAAPTAHLDMESCTNTQGASFTHA